jgi:hypothetical protein
MAIATIAKDMPQRKIIVRMISGKEEIKSCHLDVIALKRNTT